MKRRPSSLLAAGLAALMGWSSITPAWAVLNTSNSATSPSSIAASSLPARGQSCDQICNPLVTESKIRGLAGTLGWTTEDDLWCANHGNQTEALVPADPNYQTSTSANCNVRLGPNENCEEVNRRLNRCTYHNSQMEPYCMAYLSAKDAKPAEEVLIVLDIAMAAVCGVACVWGIWEAACQAGSVGVGLVEIMLALAMNETAAGRAANGLMGAAGAASYQVATNAGLSKQRSGCAAAAVFAILAALRAKALSDQKKTEQEACSAVQTLLATAGAVDPSNSVTPPYFANPNTNISTGASGGSGGGGGSSTSALAKGTQPTRQTLTCTQNDGYSSCINDDVRASVQSATDGGLLLDKDRSRLAATKALDLGLDDLINRLKKGETAGSVLGSLMGDAAETPMGKNLTALTEEIQKDPSQAQGIGINTGTFSMGSLTSGGGAKAASPTQANTSPFGGLRPLGKSVDGAAEGKELAYSQQRAPASTDIWHTGTKQSLFEIVSSKIHDNRDRVEGLEWSYWKNRAIMGLPVKPSAKK